MARLMAICVIVASLETAGSAQATRVGERMVALANISGITNFMAVRQSAFYIGSPIADVPAKAMAGCYFTFGFNDLLIGSSFPSSCSKP